MIDNCGDALRASYRDDVHIVSTTDITENGTNNISSFVFLISALFSINRGRFKSKFVLLWKRRKEK